jgi:hypothetical protein
MLLTSINQFWVRFRSGDQAARRRRVRQMGLWAADVPESRLMLVAALWVSFFKRIVVVSAALTLFLGSLGQARADLITVTAQPTFQTVESASYTPVLEDGFVQPTLTQSFTTNAAGATSNSFNLVSNLDGVAAASVDNGFNSSPGGFTDYVSLSSSAGASVGDVAFAYFPYLSATTGGSANLQGPTFTLNRPAAAVLTFDPTLTIGSNITNGVVLQLARANVVLQGNNGSSLEVSATEQSGDFVTPVPEISASSVTAGPAPIQTIDPGADSIEMNLAPGTYLISGSSSVLLNFFGDAVGGVFGPELSVNGGAELVLSALPETSTPTPEPATFTLLGSGVLAFGGLRFWRKRRSA